MASRSDDQPATIAEIVRNALFWTAIAFGLFALLIGLKTDQQANEIVLVPRVGLLAGVLLAVFVFTLAGGLFNSAIAGRGGRQASATSAMKPWHEAEPLLKPFLLAFVVAFPFVAIGLSGWQGSLKWIDNFGIQILIYVMLGWGLNVVVGLAGLLDLGYVAFYAVGAYSYALLATNYGLSFWILLPVAGILAAFWGIILGFPVLRLRGDYLAVVTLAFGEIIRLVLINWVDFSNGYAGISSIPRPTFFGIPFTTDDDGFAATFGLEQSGLYYKIFLYLSDPDAGAADRLCHHPPAPAADRPGLGGAARG
jgi:branched-chain amino acid transport system permease protein